MTDPQTAPADPLAGTPAARPGSLDPEAAYGPAPAMAYELYHLLERVAEQHKPDGEHQDERLLLVRQAALADRVRLADEANHDLDLGRAEWLAWRLRSYDERNGTAEGPIPAEDERWDADPFGYVRQEYYQWMMFHPEPDTTEQAPERP